MLNRQANVKMGQKNKQTTWWKCETGGAFINCLLVLEMKDKRGEDEDLQSDLTEKKEKNRACKGRWRCPFNRDVKRTSVGGRGPSVAAEQAD